MSLGGQSSESTCQRSSSFASLLLFNVFIEGQNVKIEYRWAEGQYDRLPALAAELVAGST
jgi:putative tryptophan/tyrosine transport system substrate-binding protein